jgi:hypothetical protein
MQVRTAAIVSALSVLSLIVVTPAARAETLTLSPSADVYTLKSSPGSNFGTVTTLRVRDPGVRSYLQFNVTGIPSGASVSAATLRLYSPTGDKCTTTGIGTDVYRAGSDGWTETTVTHSNAPGKTGVRLGTAEGFAAGSFAALDVTSAVTGNGTVSFYLEMPSCSTDTTVTRFNSREASANRPELVVVTGGDPVPDPQCSDGADNDLDGLTDYPNDPGCNGSQDNDENDPPTGGGALVVAGADIACDPNDANFSGSNPAFCQFRKTDDLLVGADAVLAVGDIQYNTSTATKLNAAYDPSWGQFAPITYPALGNHEYRDPAGGAKGYFDYWIGKGRPTGGRGNGYYSWDLGSWHMIALNTSHKATAGGVPCELGPSCAEGSTQNNWLEQDLASVPASSCVLAYWHHPLYNSGIGSGNDDHSSVKELWTDLYAANADLIVNGHEHNYQRYQPMTPEGVPSDGGIREFISGGGGKSLDGFLASKDGGFEVGIEKYGVLKLELAASSYSWEYVDLTGAVVDSGGPVACHG